jgi:hypothetical protein
MAAYRNNLGCRISGATKESLARLCKYAERSQAKVIEIALRMEEQRLLLQMSESESATCRVSSQAPAFVPIVVSVCRRTLRSTTKKEAQHKKWPGKK